MNHVKTQNESYGFWGTMGNVAQAAWDIAINEISNATSQPAELAGLFLDSTLGRHFADEVNDLMEVREPSLKNAIRSVVDRQMSKKKGHLPYLTYSVLRCEEVAR